MKLSFATLGCPNWTLEQIIANAKTMGFDGVELRGVAGEHIGPEESAAERARIRTLFADAGVEIAAIMGYSRFTIDDPEQREENIRIAIKFLETARDIGCPVLRVFGGVFSKEVDTEGNIRRVVDGLRRVAEHAERTGVNVAMETHDDWTRGELLKAVLDEVNSSRVGACWDVANSFFTEPLERTCASIGDRIMHVHFKDAARDGERSKSKLPGTGQVDLKQALSLIVSTGYDKYLSFEWEKKWEADLEEPEVAFPRFITVTRGLMGELHIG